MDAGTAIERSASPAAHDDDRPCPETLSPRGVRLPRRTQTRAQRGLVAAVLITAGIPTVLILSLWKNLTLPFWFNEQWRAYYVSLSGNWWTALQGRSGVPSAPFPAGWFFWERISAWLFGSTELVMRLTTSVFVPLGCVLLMLLARRWMPLAAAVVVALVGGLTGTLLVYAVQLAPYEVDFAAVMAVLLLHEIAADQGSGNWRSAKTYGAYGGIALACIFSTPAIFIAAPILLLDAVRAARARSLRPQTLGAAGAGLVALVHLRLFVVPQSALTKGDYWDPQFLPHSGVGSQIAFVWDGLRGFLTGTLTASDIPGLPELLSPRYSWIVTVAFASLLCLGIVTTARTERGRTILVAIAGSIGLTLIASYLRYWPYGFVRTNFYLVPVLILVAGIGASRAGGYLVERLRKQPALPTPRRVRVMITAAGLAVLTFVGVGLAVTYEAGTYRQVRDSAAASAYGIEIDSAVASTKVQAHPGSALVVAGLMAVAGWQYYQYEYTGRTTEAGRQIGAQHAVFVINHGSPTITRLVGRVDPKQLFLYVPYGTSTAEIQLDMRAVDDAVNCRPVSERSFSVTGLLYVMSCGDEPPS